MSQRRDSEKKRESNYAWRRNRKNTTESISAAAVAPNPQPLPPPPELLDDAVVVGGVNTSARTTKAILVTFVPRALVAEMEEMLLPIWVGVPEINPVAVLTLSPGGRLVAL